MNIEAIIFDLDGTIADTLPLTIKALRDVAWELTGIELSDEEILKEFGPIDTEIVKKLVKNERSDEGVEKYINYFKNHFEKYVTPIDGMIELLAYIKSRDIKVGLFTGRSRRVTHIILEKLKLESYFDEILAGDDTLRPKPDPEGIIKILERLGAENKNSIYVGDFEVDIKASRAAGVTSVLALWSSMGQEELIKYNPDVYFKSPYEFIKWLSLTEI